MSNQGDKPKIHIDSDWKAEAQAEKQRLAQSATEKQAAERDDGQGPGGGPGGKPPPADFQTLISTMISQCLMYMGGIPDPQTGQGMVHLELAKFHIDLLGVLEEKTKGNTTEEEGKLLSQAVHELRLSYLQLSKQVAEHLKKQAESGGKGAANLKAPNLKGPGPLGS